MISTRLGAILALTLAGVTITVAYDRTRDDSSKVSITSTTESTTVPETAPDDRQPVVDRRHHGPEPDHRRGDDDHGDVDSRLDARRRRRPPSPRHRAPRPARLRWSASAPAAPRARSRPTIARGQAAATPSRSCSRVTRSSKARPRASSPRTRTRCCCRWRRSCRRLTSTMVNLETVDHHARLARVEDVHLPCAGRGVHCAGGGGSRRRDDGEQPRTRLRSPGPARHARRDPAAAGSPPSGSARTRRRRMRPIGSP